MFRKTQMTGTNIIIASPNWTEGSQAVAIAVTAKYLIRQLKPQVKLRHNRSGFGRKGQS